MGKIQNKYRFKLVLKLKLNSCQDIIRRYPIVCDLMTWVGGDLHGEKCSDSGLPDSAGCPSLLPLLLQGD